MNQAEHMGARMVMLIRRRAEALAAWERADGQITELHEQIVAMKGGGIYAHTSELPAVRDEPDVTMVRPAPPDLDATVVHPVTNRGWSRS
jgi:hypothetical protein